MSDLVERLRGAPYTATDTEDEAEWTRISHEAAKEIVRLRKIVDALTVKLNKELNERYVSEALLRERIDACEHKMARLGARVEQLRYAKEGE